MFGKQTYIPIVTIVIAAIFIRNLKRHGPIVEISSGKLQGIKSLSRDGRDFYEYLNIPYAIPPVGDLRFEPPEPADKWEGIRDASTYGPVCLQADLLIQIVDGAEDCLHLNVHTPQINQNGSLKELLPVIVFIHGGVFNFGSGTLYRPTYFVDQDVVFVTINHRLGSLGFLNTGDGVIRGNMGLKDQNLALRWIQENIIHFGGDPDKVTLMGQSAGAASAHFHTLSPMSKGLFHKVIAQSGLATMPWVTYDNPQAQAIRFAEILNCTAISKTSKKIADVSCLKKLSAPEIMQAGKEYFDPLHEIISIFVPTVEVDIPDGKTFLNKHPSTIIKTGEYYKVPVITGVNSDEGAIWNAGLLRNKTAFRLICEDNRKYFPRAAYLPDDTDPSVVEKLIKFYLKDKIITESDTFDDLQGLSRFFTDRIFHMTFLNTTEMLVNSSTPSSPLFLYFYSYKSQFTLIDVLIGIEGKFDYRLEIVYSAIKTWFARTILKEKIPNYGVAHADELPMQLPLNFPFTPYVSEDHTDFTFSREFVKVWTDFAKAPNDLKGLKFMGHKWNPQKSGEPINLMKIDENPEMVLYPMRESVEFWKTLPII